MLYLLYISASKIQSAMKYLYKIMIPLVMITGSCEQKTEEKDFAKDLEQAKQKVGEWTLVRNSELKPHMSFLLETRGITNANSEHGIYLSRNTDSSGESIQPGQKYVVKGKQVDAASWSLSVYHDKKLIANRETHYVSSYEVEEDQRGQWEVHLAPQEVNNKPWLLNSGEGNKPVTLVLRIYNPSSLLLQKIDDVQLPVIVKK